MTSSKGQIPWDEIGVLDAKHLISSCDSRQFKDALAGITEPGIPDFEDRRWKYEFCIFWMFWMWYVATSPKFVTAGAAKPLLDAYHRACCEAMVQAGLVENSGQAIRCWEDDLDERFQTYKKAYDQHWAKTRENPFSGLLRGSIGWLVASYLFPGQQPNSMLVIFLNELGSFRFTGLVEMFSELEAHYSRHMTTDELMKLPVAELRKTPEFARGAVTLAQRQPRFIAWLWWRLHGRPEIRVEMPARWMELAGFPCPEVGHFDVPTYKYTRVMRTLQERVMRELERPALEPSPLSEEGRRKQLAEFKQKLEEQEARVGNRRDKKTPEQP